MRLHHLSRLPVAREAAPEDVVEAVFEELSGTWWCFHLIGRFWRSVAQPARPRIEWATLGPQSGIAAHMAIRHDCPDNTEGAFGIFPQCCTPWWPESEFKMLYDGRGQRDPVEQVWADLLEAALRLDGGREAMVLAQNLNT